MAMKNICRILVAALAAAGTAVAVSSCEPYEEKPPKTDKAIRYALPDPVYPEADEIEALKEIRKEHEDNV